MLIQYSRIDQDGLYVEPVLFDADIVVVDESLIAVPVPEGLFHPKWDGAQWIEGKSQEEIEALRNAPIPLTPEQERIEQLEADNLSLMEAIAELYEMMVGGAS